MYRILLITILLLYSSCQPKEEAPAHKKAEWISEAFTSIENNSYPRLKAISWWHENFDQSLLRVDSSTASLTAYQNAVSSDFFITTPYFSELKLAEPTNTVYHAAFPDFGGTEDLVHMTKITDFEHLVHKEITWAYFSNNWYDEITFPIANVNTIHEAGKIPFIRMMARTNFDEGGPDENYSMQSILDGTHDVALTQWAIDAANTGIPLLVEFGTEVNGNWFPWNAQYNGAGETSYGNTDLTDGAERFKDAYRHIITICNANAATNITWFFHIDAYNQPDTDWNQLELYYPGDAYIDWLGVSVYGAQKNDEENQSFTAIMNDVYPRLTNLSSKPIAVVEFAVTELD